MANIDDFMESEKLKEKLKEAYDKGYHFEWISLSHMILDTMLKSYFYISIVGSYPLRKFKDKQVDWMKSLGFWNILNIANIFGLLSNELFDNLKEVNEKRNLILHNLIMKNEKLNPIDLEKHYNLCQKTIEQLVAEWLRNTHLQGISMQIFHDAMSKFEEKQEKKKFMFDTNIFDSILDEKIDISTFNKNYEYFITHIQKDEIEDISKPEKQERKKQLLQIFKEYKVENLPTESFALGTSQLSNAKLRSIPTESAVWETSRWGEAKWGNGDLLEELRKENLIHTEDALIGETSIKNNLILVTGDSPLLNKIKSLGGKAITFEQFIKGEIE